MSQIIDQEKSPSSPPEKENVVLEWTKTIGAAVILALGIRQFIVEPRWIPSSSMEPTLQIEDRLMIEKVSYYFQKPKRGDIIVFNPTETLEKQNYTDAFIKRVIGLPGERIKVNNCRVYVNGKALPENYSFVEENDNPYCKFGPVTVPPGEYLVLGDNRNNSLDSRAWGFVPRNKLIGRAVLRFWPLNRIGSLAPTPAYGKIP